MSKALFSLCVAFAASLLLSGCATPQRLGVREQVDTATRDRLAVRPRVEWDGQDMRVVIRQQVHERVADMAQYEQRVPAVVDLYDKAGLFGMYLLPFALVVDVVTLGQGVGTRHFERNEGTHWRTVWRPLPKGTQVTGRIVLVSTAGRRLFTRPISATTDTQNSFTVALPPVERCAHLHFRGEVYGKLQTARLAFDRPLGPCIGRDTSLDKNGS